MAATVFVRYSQMWSATDTPQQLPEFTVGAGPPGDQRRKSLLFFSVG